MGNPIFSNDFQILVGHVPHGTDPSHNNKSIGQPAQIRTAIRVGNVHVERGAHIVGASRGGDQPQSGTITVVDNSFTERVVLTLGEFELVSHIHYTPGGSTGATATALAESIARLPGWSASALGSVVTVEYAENTSAKTEFRVLYDAWADGSLGGGHQNFNLTPSDGYLNLGLPSIGPVVLT